MLTHTHVTGAAALCAGAALITGVPRNELVPLLLLGVAGGLLPDVDVPYGRAAQLLAVLEGGILGTALGWLVTREILPAVAGVLAGVALAGVPVVWVDPKSTSQTCPRCGHAARANRPSQGWFKCARCGYQSDADRVGALNIAARGAMLVGYSPAREGSVAPLEALGCLSQDGSVQANLLLPVSGSRRL